MELYSDIVSPPCQNVLLVAKKLGIALNIKKTNIMDAADVAELTKVTNYPRLKGTIINQ